MKYEDFMKKLKEDQELAKQFGEKLEASGPLSEEEAWQASAEAAKELGFDVEPAEFAVEARGRQKISDEELARVSGGVILCMKNLQCYMIYNTCISSEECMTGDSCNKILCKCARVET